MSVAFRVVLHNGLSIGRSHICFGTLNGLPWDSGKVVNQYTPEDCRQDARDYLRDTHAQQDGPQQQDFSYIEYLPRPHFAIGPWSAQGVSTYEPHTAARLSGESESDALTRWIEQYFYEMKLLIKDVPVFKDIVTVNPYNESIRVHIKEHPADKVMMALFMFRNMAQYDNARSYLRLREAGYRPRVAFIMSEIFHYRARNTLGSGGWSGRSEDESSFVRPETFGENALINWMKQDFSDNLWQQGLFVEQSGGYMRDSKLAYEGYVFDEEGSGEGGVYYRHMSDTFCIPSDSSLEPDNVGWCPCNGFDYTSLAGKTDNYIQNIITRISALAEINPMLEENTSE